MGKISSIQTLGTLDGPGIRYVVFLSGCNLRCKCCHNPETWNIDNGYDISAIDLIEKVKRYKEYFKDNGGITISGGEPLLQALFVKEVFELANKEGINTCLDTSGCLLNDEIKQLLKYTDRVLLDVKYTNEKDYLNNVGCEYKTVIEFLNYLNQNDIKTTIRQVIIPTINDDLYNISIIKGLKDNYKCIDKVELLPFKKLCISKYESLNIDFPFKDKDTPSKELMEKLNCFLNN